jgi:hypothetical protein
VVTSLPSFTCLLTRSLAHSLANSSTRPSLAHSLIRSFVLSLSHSSTRPSIHSLPHSLTNSSTRPSTRSQFTHSFTQSYSHSLLTHYSLVHPLLPSLPRSLARSLTNTAQCNRPPSSAAADLCRQPPRAGNAGSPWSQAWPGQHDPRLRCFRAKLVLVGENGRCLTKCEFR